MDLEQIKALMHAMNKRGISRLRLKNESGEIELERNTGSFVKAPVCYEEDVQSSKEIQTFSHGSPLGTPLVSSQQKENGKFVTSPMVGTFYTAGSPEDSPFVKVGDKVQENSVVCIVEAMKVMNEVKANISGTITKILVENGHPVEFGTRLFEIG
jgi:acetyl-CoA carboxylase biotin carboxyl carrier protein